MDTLRLDTSDGIATLTLSRPEKMNAYTPLMGEELVEAFRAARDDDAVRVVILTGEGKGFCGGVDLDALKAMQAGERPAKGPQLGEEAFVKGFAQELLEFPKPTLAAVNGAAVGVGVTMILPLDLRIAAESAKLGVPFTKLGILPGLGSTHLLPQIVGLAKAQELVLTARIIPAEEAHAIGLVNQVVPDSELLPTARALAERIVACDPDALTIAKRGVQYGATHTMAEALVQEQEALGKLQAARAKRK